MSQYDFGNIDPTSVSGTALATALNSWRDSLLSGHSGAARPSYAVAGMRWIKIVSGTVHELYLYDGASDILLGTVNPTAHTWMAAGPNGIYLPVLTNSINVASSVAFNLQYLAVGDTYNVSGRLQVTPAATGTVNFGLSLPVASAIGAPEQLGGTGVTVSTGAQTNPMAIYGDPSNDRAVCAFYAQVTSALIFVFNFSYRRL